MPLTIPEYITIKTAAGATAAYLSPSADGIKECYIDNELNGSCVLTFSLPLQRIKEIFSLTAMGAIIPLFDTSAPNTPSTQSKWQYLTESYRIYAPDSTGTMKEFMILTPDSIDITRDGKKVMGKITAQESWVRLGKDYIDPGISNDPQTPSPPELAVIVLSGGSDLSGGLYTVGSAAHALYAILQGTGWSVGTVDQEGTHDLETEKISVLANVQKIQETWGGYLVWDSVNKTVSLRDEETWAPYSGYQIRYAKNLKGISRVSDFDIVTKLYPFGEDDLNIGSVNGGQKYLTNNTYTTEILEGIWTNQDIADATELMTEATKYLAKVCRPRHNYRIDQVDLRTLSGYAHESFDVGHMVDIIDTELDTDDQARVIRHRFNVFQPWICELEVGDPLDTDAKLIADSQITVNYLNSIKNSNGQITGYKIVDGSVISQKIATAAIDATKLNTKVVVLLGDTWTDNSPAGGSVAWNQHKLYYAGVEHVIVAGSTAQKYIYWDGIANTYSTSADMPTLTDGQFIIAVNNGGLHETVWDKGYAREFIGSALIADAAILSAHIALAQILDAHIVELSANKINVTDLTALSSEDGYSNMKGDGFRVYDEAGNLMGHLGSFKTLGPVVAAFTRASIAYEQDGSLVASGVPRYEAVGDRLGVMLEEGCTNIVATWPTGWAVGGDVGMLATDMGVLAGAALNTVRLTNSGATYGSYISPLFALSPSTTYTFKFKTRGTVGIDKFNIFVLSATGTLVQCAVYNDEVAGVFTEKKLTFTTTADITGTNQYIRFDHNGNDAGYIEIAEVEIIQKPYPLTFPGYGATRADEVLTTPSSVLNKGDWAVELDYTPNTIDYAYKFDYLWICLIDANNYYALRVDQTTGYIALHVVSGGVAKSIIRTSAVTVGTVYRIMVSGDNSIIRLCINGEQIGSDLAYTEPVGTLPANMDIGNFAGGGQANGPISNIRFSNRARTLAEHQTYVNSGLPLTVDDATTYLMSCDGTLQPTLRYFGLYTKNGRFILQDPATGQGIEVWDGATLKVLIGRLLSGKIGAKFIDAELYSSLFRTGAEGDTDYIELAPPNALRVIYGGQKTVEIVSAGTTGNIALFENGTETARLTAEYNIDTVNHAALRSINSSPLALVGPVSLQNIQLQADGEIEYHAGTGQTNTFFGDIIMGSGTKSNMEETESFGKRLLVVRESPEQKYVDEGIAELINGVCVVPVCPVFLECIESNTENTPWITRLTPKGPFTIYEAEIGDSYFIVKSHETGINGKFSWELSATRKNYAGVRFKIIEDNADLLTSNWEDDFTETLVIDETVLESNWEDVLL